MRRRTNWIFAVMLASVLLLPGMVLAQADDDARDTVLAAIQAASALGGYHLESKSNYLTKITPEDGDVTNTYTIQRIDGDVSQNGDRHFTRALQTAENFENAAKMEPLVIEQILSDGETYMNFHTEGTVYENIFTVKPGWWEYDHLIESLDGNVMTYTIQQYANVYTTLDAVFRDDLILSVVELKPEKSNGLDLRVFDVEIDSLKLQLEQNAVVGLDQGQALTQSKDLLAASEITLNYRLWIGADDGLIYRGKGEQRTFIPYNSAGTDSDPNFDFEASGSSAFTISQYDEPVEIHAPDPVSLNE